MECAWKANWQEARQHFCDWWDHRGLVLYINSAGRAQPHEPLEKPAPARSLEQRYTDAAWRARWEHYRLANQEFPADSLPIASTDIGPGSLALFVGSEPGFSEETVWFDPCPAGTATMQGHQPIRFDPANRWWRTSAEIVSACADLGRGKYLVGCPDLVENVDILAALRAPSALLIDLIERPDWVLEKVEQINQVWFEAYQRLYDLIRLEDGSSSFGAFLIWGPGKTAKVQCDASAMFSPKMFARFVLPALTRQCQWLDYSLFHLDGHQCLPHLDLLLEIEALDAIEFTPDPQVPSGGNLHWAGLYRRILEAGKSVQAVGVKPAEVLPLLDAVGGAGMFLLVDNLPGTDLDRLLQGVEPYR
jgi:hypothetical protein